MMKFYWIRYERLSNRAVEALLQENEVHLIGGQDNGYGSNEGELLVTGKPTADELKQLVWDRNGGAFCQVIEADYDDIEHLL